MIDKLEINNFRGIRSASIEKLARVNIFFGKNNCGKTSLLESLFLLSGMSNPTLSLNINHNREYLRLNISDLDINFYNLDASNPIVIRGYKNDALARELEITKFISQNQRLDVSKLASQISSNSANLFYGYKLKFIEGSNPDEIMSSDVVISPDLEDADKYKSQISVDKRYKEKIVAKMIVSTLPFSQRVFYLNEILKNKQEEVLIRALSKFDNRIKNISLVGDDIMVDIGLETLLPVNVMGDGVRKLLSLVVSIYECKNGILLIDEIDNGLHFSVMRDVFKILLEVAQENNVQLFFTTHNIDLIQSISSLLLEDDYVKYQTEVLAHKLIHDDSGVLHVLTYDYEKLNYSLDQELEVR
ncbi:MAG: AAA family ATPase [bacterium]